MKEGRREGEKERWREEGKKGRRKGGKKGRKDKGEVEAHEAVTLKLRIWSETL